MAYTLKKKLYDIFEETRPASPSIHRVNLFILCLILLNVFAVICETEQALYTEYKVFFKGFQALSLLVFTVEYILRLWSCTVVKRFKGPLWGRVRYALHPLALLDLAALLSFYGTAWIPYDLRLLRVFRLFRLSMVFKAVRTSDTVKSIIHILKTRKVDILITVFVALVLLLTASTMLYWVESKAQPLAFGSIPQAMWWAAMTISTIGYGDVYPITPLGKLCAGIIAILSIGLFALPAGILSSIFIDEIRRLHDKADKHNCPHCGKSITK